MYQLDPTMGGYQPQMSPYELTLLRMQAEGQVPQPQQGGMNGSSAFDLAGSMGGGSLFGSSSSAAVPVASHSLGAGGAGTVTGAGAEGMLSGMGAALPWLGVAGIGAYTGYKGFDAWNKAKHKGAMGGLKQGIKSAGILNAVPILGQVPWMAGFAQGAFGGKKHKDQYARDAWRSPLKGNLLDDAYNVTLADGSKYNIGADGHRQYDVDMSRAGAGDAIAGANPLAHLLSRGSAKLRSDGAGYLANAAMSSGDTRSNLLKQYYDVGLDHDKAYGAIAQDNKLDKGTRDAYLNGLDQLFGVGAYAGGRQPRPQPQASPQPPKSIPMQLAPRTSNAWSLGPQLTSMRR